MTSVRRTTRREFLAAGASEVAGENAGGEAVGRGVGPGDGLVLGGESEHGHDGAEDFLVGQAVVRFAW